MRLIENRDYNNQLTSINLVSSCESYAFTLHIISDTEIIISSTDYVRVDNKIYDRALEIVPVNNSEIRVRKPLLELLANDKVWDVLSNAKNTYQK